MCSQSGWIELPVEQLPGRPFYMVRDLLNGPTYLWRADGWNYVELEPSQTPAHVFHVERTLIPEATVGA